jgi:hypothetical protein
MKSVGAVIVCLCLLTISVASLYAEEPAGREATCEDLIGFWKLVPLNDSSINEVDPWPLPYQWFGFYPDGRMVSMGKTEDASYSKGELDEILTAMKASAPKYRCEDSWLLVEYQDGSGIGEVWGKNIFTRRAGLKNKEPFEIGDVVMSLSATDDGRPMYFRWLRPVLK